MPSNPGKRKLSRKDIHLDIDAYLNPFIPPNPIKWFPKPIARFLGHRDEPAKELGNIVISSWALVGAFLGLLITAATYKFSDHLQIYHPPILFASLGATAILDYNTIQSPLAQPRAAIVGHGLSAITGVAIARLFELSSDIESLRWIAGPTACAVASFVMSMTNTVHPPGGATAVLAAVDPTTIRMGWMFVPFIILGSTLMFGVACLVNNIQRQFPVFWWTPQEVGSFWRKQRKPKQHDIEDAASSRSVASESKTDGGSDEKDTLDVARREDIRQMIVLTPEQIILPDGLDLERNTMQILEMLSARLREKADVHNHHHSHHQNKHHHGDENHDVLRVASGTSHGSTSTHVDLDNGAVDDKVSH